MSARVPGRGSVQGMPGTGDAGDGRQRREMKSRQDRAVPHGVRETGKPSPGGRSPVFAKKGRPTEGGFPLSRRFRNPG